MPTRLPISCHSSVVRAVVRLGLFLLADGLTARHRRGRGRGGAPGQALHRRVQGLLDRAGLRRVGPWEFLLASAIFALLGGLVAGDTLHWPCSWRAVPSRPGW